MPAAIRRLILINRDIFIRTMSLLLAFAYFTKSGTNLGTDIVAANAILLKFMEFAAYGLNSFRFRRRNMCCGSLAAKIEGVGKN